MLSTPEVRYVGRESIPSLSPADSALPRFPLSRALKRSIYCHQRRKQVNISPKLC